MDELREKSVFSELIGGQRQQENPETENDDEPSIDTGLIGDDNVDDVEVSTQYLQGGPKRTQKRFIQCKYIMSE